MTSKVRWQKNTSSVWPTFIFHLLYFDELIFSLIYSLVFHNKNQWVMYTLLHCCWEKKHSEYNQCDPYIYIIVVNVWGNNELSENGSIQMSDLRTDPRGGAGWSHLPTVNRPCALNKQTHSLACYQRWSFSNPLYRNNHFQSLQLNAMEPRGFRITEWEQCRAALQWLVIIS